MAKLQSGEYYVGPKVHAKGRSRSTAWDLLMVVYDKATRLEVGTARCIVCGKIMVSTSGPSSLKKHKDKFCVGVLAGETTATFCSVPVPLRTAFIDKVVDTCALTMGSFNLLTSEAVMDMIQRLPLISDCAARAEWMSAT